MLIHLILKDFAVVSTAELVFERGLTVVSGETGAGKSLLVDALLWLTGARADAGIVRHGAERAELFAEFQLQEASDADAWLRENELEDGNICQLRRIIRADGGSRAWINGRPATLAQLSELGALLVEIHGQHEHQALLERNHQRDLLDAFGQHEALLSEVRGHAKQWLELEREIAELSRHGEASDRVDYLEHQWAELMKEALEDCDIEQMLSAHRRQANAASLLSSYDTALTQLSGEDGFSVARGLRQVNNELTRHADNEAHLAEITALLDCAEVQIDEAVTALERLRDDLDLDPQHLQQLEARLARLHDLSRKHRVPIHELATCRDALENELNRLRSASERSQGLLADRETALKHWQIAAEKLSQARQSAATTLAAAVSSLMGELGMAGGLFVIELQPQENAKPHASGAERCEFLVSANPGQPPRALRKVASGGELARISLAIEVAALGLDTVPTMVFDEVDTGIGGAVAEVVGQKLRTLGASRQVLCVTHLAQVAAQGHHHFQVSKAVSGSNTYSAVSVLDEKTRVEELARMLGGVEITKETRANAKQMLERAQNSNLSGAG